MWARIFKGAVGLAIAGVLAGLVWMVSAATAPFFASAKAKALAEQKMHELGGGELIEFQHFHGEHYRAIYRQGSDRFDIHVENGKTRVQTGLPLLCSGKASR